MYCLRLLPSYYLATEILQRFTVRIHSRIVEKGRAWARLWYLLRALDREGSGFASIPLVEICELLATSPSTIRQWLREGETAGAFRWRIRGGILRTHLGGLSFLSHKLGFDSSNRTGIAPWGVVAEIPLHKILSLAELRAAATTATAQRLQQLSRFAAWKNLPKQARKKIKLPQPDAFFQQNGEEQRLSHNNARGSIRCCIHIGKHRAWVSKGFIPFGTSQKAIAQERNLCDQTIRRHLALMKIDRRQIVQSKGEYKSFAQAVEQDYQAPIAKHEECILECRGEDYWLTDQPGGIGKAYQSKVGEVGFTRIRSRFFQYGKKSKTWMYRCNIYRPSVKLCTMSRARRNYARRVLQNRRPGGDSTPCNSPFNQLENFKEPTPSQAEKDKHFS